ncbi:Autophagy-related protein 13 [Penicillium odoratum]|uniref:Autophagy-related protein 13 n=1 Tax=Penicillium odoratum TaxID=1167516 RepID=UPI002546C4D1|nr:Autophagy-related protein 13 [Penicillium odoratum]KAJ5759257.1 Autophagy-related protein 13 [Penicillium odoratum]
MHQNPRSPAVPPGAPGPSKLPSKLPPRNDLKDPESTPASPTTDMRANQNRGLGIEAGGSSSEQARAANSGNEALAKLNQIISNYHTKAALIILHSRVELPQSFIKGSNTPRVNRWFNVELDETDILRESLQTWRNCDATDNRPPPLIIETFIDTRGLTNNESLVILDDHGKRWDVQESLAASPILGSKQSGSEEVILERWKIELGGSASRPPADLATILPTVYKKSIVLFRSLFTYSKFLPAWKFSRGNAKARRSPALQIRYRVVDGSSRLEASLDNLTAPLFQGNGKVVETYSFGVTESPAGPFSVEVTYRTNCDFRIDDSEALLSSRFMGADDDIFRPSLPKEDTIRPEVGSMPVGRRAMENPDRSRAYGSLSTFHQVGPAAGSSPISALRAARDAGDGSPSPTESYSKKLLPAAKIGATGRAAKLANESGSSKFARRPSVSFPHFKAGSLSDSPAFDHPLGVSPRTTTSARGSAATSVDSRIMPPPSSAASARRPASLVTDHAIPSPTSASPKPAPLSRFSSSFSQRRARPSSGGGHKLEDETSSGKASATSSNMQPGSGLLAEVTGTSAESIHADDENISDFLKFLDLKKDLMSRPPSSASQISGPRKPTATSASLARFQQMRDSNAALSDSMSASVQIHRSSISSSKQLSGVPPMVAGTSISTASSPGKPISPHTPHTPAIRSRLSSNSVVDDISTEHNRPIPRIGQDGGGSPLDENSSMETTQRAPSTAAAIDIPTSPRPFAPAFRRSSSAAQRRRPSAEEDDIFSFGMRSVSLGIEERSHLRRQADQETTDAHTLLEPGSLNLSLEDPSARAPPAAVITRSRDAAALRSQTVSVPAATSTSSNANLYQPRFGTRGRGSSGGPHSLSSASSSLARGGTIPHYLTEREERDGNASGSNSGNSTMEIRRSSFQRRPPPSQFEDDEPLLFAMSDFGASRRSLEENRHGNHGGADSGAGSRRGSGRRGAGPPSWN